MVFGGQEWFWYMVEAAGIEPATPDFEDDHQRQSKTTKDKKK